VVVLVSLFPPLALVLCHAGANLIKKNLNMFKFC
jgi:hypothetical protein